MTKVNSLADLNSADKNKMFFVINEKFIYYWDGTKWSKVNVMPEPVGSLKQDNE